MDRNLLRKITITVDDGSLSARRAWIEMELIPLESPTTTVALRKESVDRNFYFADKDADWVRSLSARRAWIEIRLSTI